MHACSQLALLPELTMHLLCVLYSYCYLTQADIAQCDATIQQLVVKCEQMEAQVSLAISQCNVLFYALFECVCMLALFGGRHV